MARRGINIYKRKDGRYEGKYREWAKKAEGDAVWAEANPLVFDVEINQ